MVTKYEPVRIDYPKRWFVLGTLGWAVATLVIFYLAETSKEEVPRWLWLIVGLAEGSLLGIFFVPPMFTFHLAGEKALRLKMGLLIDATIPYSWMRQIKDTSVRWGGVRVGLGVRYAPITRMLFVTTEFNDLVSIRFEGPHAMGRLFRRQVEEVILSVSNKSRLFDLVREKARLDREV
jgi:hypothetical protein